MRAMLARSYYTRNTVISYIVIRILCSCISPCHTLSQVLLPPGIGLHTHYLINKIESLKCNINISMVPVGYFQF